MELTKEQVIIHQPVRLRLMGLLHRRGDVGAVAARAALEVTAGNLDAHARKLADVGLLEARRVLRPTGFEVRYRITRRGSEAFRDYLDRLEAFLGEAR